MAQMLLANVLRINAQLGRRIVRFCLLRHSAVQERKFGLAGAFSKHKVVEEDWTGVSLALLVCSSVGSGTWSGNTVDTDVKPDLRCLGIQSCLEHLWTHVGCFLW